MSYGGHRDQRWGPTTYAQHGDDLMILNLFDLMGFSHQKSYLDVGAHHPTDISNTRLLYENGWRGVHVEANPKLVEAFKRERPDEKVLNVGVGLAPGEAEFYMYSDTSGRNTFSPAEVKSLEGILTVRQTVKLPIVTLQSIVDTEFGGVWPSLLSMDIEGLDYDVLQATRFGGNGSLKPWGPFVVVVETRRDDTRKMCDMMRDKGYAYHSRMGENLFFVRQAYTQWTF